MQTYQVMQNYNNSMALFAHSDTYENAEEGVTIHKITTEQAMANSTRLKVAAAAESIPLTIAMGCEAIESTFDPNCMNENIGTTSAGVARSNPTNNPLYYDIGAVQFKDEYLIGVARGVTDVDSAKRFALDVDEALPYFCGLMASKILWAQNIIQANAALRLTTNAALQHAQVTLSELQATYGPTTDPTQMAEIASAANAVKSAQDEYDTACKPDHRLANPYLLATGAYNFGNTGMLAYYEQGVFPSHCQHVLDLERYFAAQLGVESVFPTDF